MKIRKLLILVSGSGSNAAAIVNAFASYSTVDITIGCNRKNAGIWKRDLDVSVEYLPSPGQDFSALKNHLLKNRYKWIILAGYMRVLPPDIIELMGKRVLNIHPSLLPLYKGSEDGYADAFNNKDEYSGCTVHFVTNEVDSGKIIAQVKFKIPEPARKDLALLKEIGLHFEHQIYPQIIMIYLGLCLKSAVKVKADRKYNIKEVSLYINEKLPFLSY